MQRVVPLKTGVEPDVKTGAGGLLAADDLADLTALRVDERV